jgi:hypothetical protein
MHVTDIEGEGLQETLVFGTNMDLSRLTPMFPSSRLDWGIIAGKKTCPYTAATKMVIAATRAPWHHGILDLDRLLCLPHQ